MNMYTSVRTLLPGAMLMFLCGCAIVDNVSEDGTAGYLSFGFEEAAFRPCGVDESWWVAADPEVELWDTYAAVAGDPLGYIRVYARLVGSRSSLGRYGHLGAYDREFSVTAIVEMREVKGDDCTWPGDVRLGPQ